MRIGALVRSTISYLLLGLVLVFIGTPCFLLTLLPARWRYDNRFFFWCSHIFYKAAVKTTMVPVTFVGKRNIPKKPAIFVANHQSAMDIPLIGLLLNKFPHIWLAKSELARSWLAPIVRRMAVLIDMSTPYRGLRSLKKSIRLIKDKQRHAIVFPEGARHIDGNTVHKFFAGFAMMAKHANRPVVPIMIFDAYKVYPPGSFFVNRYPIKVVVGKPFHLQEGEDTAAFRDRVYLWFTQQLAKAEN